MKKALLLLFSVPLWVSCNPSDSVEFGREPGPLAYNDEAPARRKTICPTSNCDNPLSEEQYEYNAAGQLTRINFMSRNTSAKLELYAYLEQQFNADGQLVRKTRYGKYGTNASWTPNDEYEYEYANGVLKTERQYFNQRNPDQRVLTGRIDYVFKDGKKTEQIRYDMQQKVLYRVAYEYRNAVLTREIWSDADDKVFRLFEHTFAGPRRQISEFLPNSKEQISAVERRYDGQGRLVSEETKVINPLLCSMMAGLIRYEY